MFILEIFEFLKLQSFQDILHQTRAVRINQSYKNYTLTFELSGTRSKALHVDGLDLVANKPVSNIVGNFKPPHSCREHMLNDLPSVLANVNIPELVGDCTLVAEESLKNIPPGTVRLTDDEALAISAYSCDTGVKDPKSNIYFVMNEVLREKDPSKVEKMKPLLAYLISGFTKLPPVKATVYQGIPSASMKLIEGKYGGGINVQWSGFTSTTKQIERAKKFAKENGIIFRIKILTGRSIEHYSFVPSEEEILLSPNCQLFVIAPVHLESDGFYYVDLTELKQETFVY